MTLGRYRFFLYSLLGHLLLLLPSLSCEPPAKELVGSQQEVQIIELGPTADGGCKDYYEGIGISESFDGTIMWIAKGYPAEKSGLLPGDIIQPGDEIRGPAGTIAKINVLRDGKLLQFDIKRGRICYGG